MKLILALLPMLLLAEVANAQAAPKAVFTTGFVSVNSPPFSYWSYFSGDLGSSGIGGGLAWRWDGDSGSAAEDFDLLFGYTMTQVEWVGTSIVFRGFGVFDRQWAIFEGALRDGEEVDQPDEMVLRIRNRKGKTLWDEKFIDGVNGARVDVVIPPPDKK